MADTDFQAITEAAAHFADIWAGLLRGELADSYGCALTCPEANAAADLYRALGLDDLADDIIAAHAERDTSQDQHYQGDSTLDAGSPVLRRTAATLLQGEARRLEGAAGPHPFLFILARARWRGRGVRYPASLSSWSTAREAASRRRCRASR